MWTPDVYQGAPAPVTGFLATVSKTAVFAMLMRFAVSADPLSGEVVALALASFAVLSMIVGNVLALMQENLKRILAYSSIAHMGYLMIALLSIARLPEMPFAVETALIYLAGYTITTLTAFAVVSMLSSAEVGDDAQTIEQYKGLFWRHPWAATCLTAALLSLMGMPLTIGFIGKLYLIAAGVQGAMWMLLWTLIIGSAISVYYYVKVIYAMTLNETAERYPHPKQTGADLPIVITLGIAVVVIGIYPAPLIEIVRTLMGGFGL
jgi:NADH-quinone oxidoreductase subunit N